MDPELLGPLGLAVGGGLGVLVVTILKHLRKSGDAPAAPAAPAAATTAATTTAANANVFADISAKLDILVEDLQHRARDRAHDQMARHAASQTAESVASMGMTMQRQQLQLDSIRRDVDEILEHTRRH